MQSNGTPEIKPEIIEKTSGRLFPNGAIELVDDKGRDSLKLLFWNGSKAAIKAQLNLDLTRTSDVQPVIFAPVRTDASVRQAVRFPSHADSFGTSRQLLNDICEVIKRYTNLTDNSVLVAAHAVRASWFPEAPDFPVGDLWSTITSAPTVISSIVVHIPQSAHTRRDEPCNTLLVADGSLTFALHRRLPL